MNFLSYFIFLIYLFNKVNSLYFHIGEKERKCFIEEIPEETIVVGKYKCQLYDPRTNGIMESNPSIGMHVQINDPLDKLIMSKVYSAESSFTFTSHNAGEHVICLYSNSSNIFSGSLLRVHLEISVGEHAVDYDKIVHKDKLTELQLRLKQLLDQATQIAKEQNYQRLREERFRATSESTNSRVLYWSIVQIFILIGMGIWQMKHLKNFFEAKKLV